MKPDLLKLNNKFINTGTISSTDLDIFADNNFSSIDSSTGNEVFMVARQSARWLLRGLKHEPLTEAQAKRVMRLKEIYAYHGSKTSFSKKPVIIDKSSCTLKDGIVRLYAVALMRVDNPSWRVSLPILFEGEP